MTAKRHPSWEEILEVVESPERADAAIREHVRTCDRCAALAEEARGLLARFAEARLPRPPEEAIERALEALGRRLREREAAAAGGLPAELRQIVAGLRNGYRAVMAALIADSWQASRALRGTAGLGSRVLIFETDTYSISLSLTSQLGSAGREVIGQVIPREGTRLPPTGWALAGKAPDLIGQPLTDLGEFQLTGVTPQMTELKLVLGDECVTVPLPCGPASTNRG